MAKEWKIKQIVKRNGAIVPFNQEKITIAIYKAAAAVGGHNRILSENLSDKVCEILEKKFPAHLLPGVEEIQDIVEKVLIENGHAKTAKAYILYRAERAKARETVLEPDTKQSKIPYEELYRVFSWNVKHKCETISNLNELIKIGNFPELIKKADQAYRSNIKRAAQKILEKRNDIRIIIICGPSASGKTTTTHFLSNELERGGLELIALNLDNYFFDLELHPKDEYGDYDFETPEALDLQLINEHLTDLLEGKKIVSPVFNFKTGKRDNNSFHMQLKKNQLLLIDSLHGLYKGLTEKINRDLKYNIYIETLSQQKDEDGRFVRFTDLRLMRRMVRDMAYRNYDPKRTLEHWHYVRRSELKHIIPNIIHADFILNGALPYELPIHKKYLFSHFKEFVKIYKTEKLREDANIRANRILNLLKKLEVIEDDSCISGESLLREFIGGSTIKY